MKPELAARLRYYPSFDSFIDAKSLQKEVDLALKWELITKRINAKEIALPRVVR